MRKRLGFTIFAVMALAAGARASDEILPAASDSEGLAQFDRSVSVAPTIAPKAGASNFGGQVSDEAHKLKQEGLNGPGFGAWVSSQRRQNGDSGNAASAGDTHGEGAGNPTLQETAPRPGGGGNQGNGNGNGTGGGHNPHS